MWSMKKKKRAEQREVQINWRKKREKIMTQHAQQP